MKVRLPAPVAAIYRAVEELSAMYPGRKFTPDGHLVGSIGEVVAAEALGLTLYPSSNPAHDAYDADGNEVQIKMTAGKTISMYADCSRLVVLRVVSPEEAEIVYDGPGALAWAAASKMQKNGQRSVSLSKLRAITVARSPGEPLEKMEADKRTPLVDQGAISANSKTCPECGHVFKGKGWDGIDAHWRSKHEEVMPYESAWPLLKGEIYPRRPASEA